MSWTYSKFNHSFMRDKKFRSLASSDARYLMLWFMLNEHQVSIGCYRLPDGYAVSDTGFELERYRRIRDDLEAAGLIMYDTDSMEVLIVDWFEHNPPMNDRHATGIRKEISSIESDTLRSFAEERFLMAEELRPPDKPKRVPKEDVARLVTSVALQRRIDPFNRV